MIVYGSSLSPFVRKVLAFAAEKGLEVENVPTTPGDLNPAFRAVSPFGKMPGFQDGDFAISDSSAIVAYLDAAHPDPNLIPSDPKARARTIWFDEYADTILAGCGLPMFRNRIVLPLFIGQVGDAVAADAAERELPPALDYLEGVAPEPGAFLVEDRLTLADIAVASQFVNFRHLGLDLSRWPRATAYAEAILVRPSFAGWVERETRFVAKVRAARAEPVPAA